MMRQPILPLVALAALGVATLVDAPAAAQTPDGPEGNRFVFDKLDDGYLRLDKRTGLVSLCNRSASDWLCRVVPDDRAAFEAEIARLQGENATLKTALGEAQAALAAAKEAAKPPTPPLPVPPPAADNATPPKERKPILRLPTDAELDQAVAFMEKAWRRVLEMMTTLQQDLRRKT